MFFRDEGPQVCVYCGNIAGNVDHVPPLVWVYALGSEYFLAQAIRLILVPACDECNGALGSLKLFTLIERSRYLLGRYEKKYEKFLRGEIWSKEDIDELGRGLRERIDRHRTCQIGFERRIRILEEGLRKVP